MVCLLCTLSSVITTAQESPNLTEISSGWRMTSAKNVTVDDALVSQASFDASHWYAAQHMPATVLQILQENGVYKDLYFGMNLSTPGDLWKQDWWYRTTFNAPPGREVYSLIFKGINYRADIWLNGHKVANRATVVGMYDEFELNVTEFIVPGGSNVLAVKSHSGTASRWSEWRRTRRQLAGLDQLEISGLSGSAEKAGYFVCARQERGRMEAGISQQHGCGNDSKSVRRHRSAASRDQPGCIDRLLRLEQRHGHASVGHFVGRDFTSEQRND